MSGAEANERVSLGWLSDEVDVEENASGSRAMRRTLLHRRSFATSSQARRWRVHYLCVGHGKMTTDVGSEFLSSHLENITQI
jgi:hypothetical protein